MRHNRIILGLIFCFLAGLGYSQDAQWRGPARDGIYPDKGLLKQWPAEGPKLVLKKEGLGAGWTTPVISEKVIYVSGRRDSVEVLSALTMDGTIVWETEIGTAWMANFPDSRNSPTIEGNRIYIASATGRVNCIEKNSGKTIWKVEAHETFKAEYHRWGFAESIVLTDMAVISSPVGQETALVALDKTDGSLLWKTESLGEDEMSYASPTIIEYNGIKLILAQTSVHLIAVNPENGEIVWKFDLVKDHAPDGRRNNTNTALCQNGEIFVTSGYNSIAVMLKLSEDGKSVSLKWDSEVLDNHHGGVVFVNGYIFGSNWLNNGNGNWVCLDWNKGEVKYEEKWINKGSIIAADGLLYLYEEKTGHVGLVEPDPNGFKLISSFKIEDGTGPHWAHPSIYDGYLIIRHGEVIMLFDIMKERDAAKVEQ